MIERLVVVADATTNKSRKCSNEDPLIQVEVAASLWRRRTTGDSFGIRYSREFYLSMLNHSILSLNSFLE